MAGPRGLAAGPRGLAGGPCGLAGGPCGLAGGPRKSWLWLAALQGSACFVGLAAACERTENGFLLLTARGSAGRSNQGMQRISHLSYYTTPAVGKSRTAATGRSGWAEAADRFARAALCLRLLYHKTLSTGTKTRGKSGSCLKNIRNSERGSARFSGNPCSRNRPSSGESSGSGKTLVPEKQQSVGNSVRVPPARRNFRFRGNLPKPGRPGCPVLPPNAAGERGAF